MLAQIQGELAEGCGWSSLRESTLTELGSGVGEQLQYGGSVKSLSCALKPLEMYSMGVQESSTGSKEERPGDFSREGL